MEPIRYDLDGSEPLPPIEGPKMKAFVHNRDSVEIRELISPTTNDSHAYVFRASIDGKEYALKVFKFFSIAEGRKSIQPFANHQVDDSTFAFHNDPFFAECRAYGKIQELEKERAHRLKRPLKHPQLAVPCHGFMSLTAVRYDGYFHERFNITEWNRLPADREQPVKNRYPFRVLVKELVSTGVTLSNGRKMLNDLNYLKDNGVWQGDVHERNYLNGLLVDFSRAWTKPHWIYKILSEENLITQWLPQLENWDDMVKRTGFKTKMRALEDTEPSLLKRDRLRPRRMSGESPNQVVQSSPAKNQHRRTIKSGPTPGRTGQRRGNTRK